MQIADLFGQANIFAKANEYSRRHQIDAGHLTWPVQPQAKVRRVNALHTLEPESRTRSPESAGAEGERLTFRLGSEEYGIDILRVQEIRGYEQPTRIANAPPFVLGVRNLRGVIVPIVDLRLKFGMAEAVYGDLTVTVVLNVRGRTVGVVVDSVSDVIELARDQIKPSPEFNAAVGPSYIVGIGTVAHGETDRILILLDIEGLMASSDMGLVDSGRH